MRVENYLLFWLTALAVLIGSITVLARFAIDAYLHSSVYKGAMGSGGDTGGGETP